jgi:chromosome transmission fidelity protein 1
MDFSLSLSTPDSFPIFPYDAPYDIQLNLMQHLYRAIEDRVIAVVESPTGTVNCPKVHLNIFTLTMVPQGKTASLLGATISWLLDDHERAKKGYLSHLATDDRTFLLVSRI